MSKKNNPETLDHEDFKGVPFDSFLITDESDWLLLMAELYWNPWVYNGEANA